MEKNKITTIYDVAGMAKVSLATVSRVLNNPDKVNDNTKKRVIEVIEKLGYKPNPIARDLATKKTKPIVCIILSNITHTSVSQIVSGVLKIADDSDYDVKVSLFSREKELKEFSKNIINEKVDGIIFINELLENDEIKQIKMTFDNYNIPSIILEETNIDSNVACFNGVSAMKSIIKR